MHPTFSFNTFIADSAFDSYEIFSMLKEKFNFSRICIPLNSRNSKYDKPNFNENGIPLCPISNEPFKYQGICREKGRSDRIKWVCPKAKPYNKGIFLVLLETAVLNQNMAVLFIQVLIKILDFILVL